MSENFTVAENFILPSGGEIYDKKVNPVVQLRSMTAREEMRVLQSGAAPFKTLSDVIENCMIEKPAVHVYDMALGDYEFLLHKLRVVSFGPDYKMSIGCPYCGKDFETKANLDELEPKIFDKAAFDDFRTFVLPKSKRTVTIKFQTPSILDTIEIKEKEMRRKAKNSDTDFKTLVLLTNLIEAIDGEIVDSFTIETFINTLPAMDMLKILQMKDKVNACLGLNNDWTVSCPQCGNDIKTFFRFGPEFFEPTID